GAGGKGISNGHVGAMGLTGAAGQPGRPGRPGNPGQAFVYQLEQELFSCLSKLDAILQVQDPEENDYAQCKNLETSQGASTPIRVLSSTQNKVLLQNQDDGSIYMNAEGSDGQNAISMMGFGGTPSDGSSGANGGHLTVLFEEIPDRVFISAIGGKGGDGANGQNGTKGADGADGRNGNWFHSATPGANGSDGGRGGNGSNGGSGGAGGNIRVIYVHSSNSSYSPNWRGSFQVNVEGGQAGRGALGGKGGRGGAGGIGGQSIWRGEIIPNGSNGKPGASGSAGRDGLVGAYGQVDYQEADSLSNWIVDEFKTQTENLFRPNNFGVD
ncbi:MAG: hypothetical protein JWQ35_2432, partial [Bacteriovoracaceae bacterium]|nr:hypothetical protein [Bacteriovoracaceae bacterium]